MKRLWNFRYLLTNFSGKTGKSFKQAQYKNKKKTSDKQAHSLASQNRQFRHAQSLSHFSHTGKSVSSAVTQTFGKLPGRQKQAKPVKIRQKQAKSGKKQAKSVSQSHSYTQSYNHSVKQSIRHTIVN